MDDSISYLRSTVSVFIAPQFNLLLYSNESLDAKLQRILVRVQREIIKDTVSFAMVGLTFFFVSGFLCGFAPLREDLSPRAKRAKIASLCTDPGIPVFALIFSPHPRTSASIFFGTQRI
jgi:hypothetical protein